jgi:hypothetical protein
VVEPVGSRYVADIGDKTIDEVEHRRSASDAGLSFLDQLRACTPGDIEKNLLFVGEVKVERALADSGRTRDLRMVVVSNDSSKPCSFHNCRAA